MEINVIQIAVIIILACLAWWVNATLNTVPILNKIISVIIVVVSVLLVLQACGLMSGLGAHIRVN